MEKLTELYQRLSELREIIKAHPEWELVNTDPEKGRYFTEATFELSRDQVDADLASDQFAKPYQHYLDKFPGDTKDHALAVYNAVACLANDCLISEDGGCNWENHSLLRDLGFPVRPGETDSFGWLSGVIYCDEFFFAFG